VTESIWQQAGFGGQLIVSMWPENSTQYSVLSAQDETMKKFDLLKQVITDMRRLRSEQGIEPAIQVEFALSTEASVKDLILNNMEIIRVLTRASSVQLVDSLPAGWPTLVGTGVTIAVNALATVDVEKEKEKIAKELTQLEAYVVSTGEKLQNTEFLSKAPEKVKQDMERKLAEAKTKKKFFTINTFFSNY
jgi:valyl-tRNA synthetase